MKEKNNTTKNNKYMYNKEIDVESIGNGSRNKNKYFNKNYNRNIQVIKSQGQYISTNENTDNFKQNDQLYKSDNLKKMKNNEEIEDKTNIYSCCKFMSCIEKIMNKYRKKTFYEIEKIFIQKKYGNSKENIEKYYKKKLYKYFKKITIKRLFYDSEKIRRIFEIEKLIKITKINKQISEDRWMRQIIRRWRFLTYTKILAKKKLKFLYKNLYNGYIESVKNIYNDNNLFEDQKESEKINQGMFIDVNYYNREREIYNKIKEKYILKPIEYDRVNQNAIINGRIVNDLLENSKNEEMPVNDKKISKLFSKNYKKDEY